jgi:hypothetical protein
MPKWITRSQSGGGIGNKSDAGSTTAIIRNLPGSFGFNKPWQQCPDQPTAPVPGRFNF